MGIREVRAALIQLTNDEAVALGSVVKVTWGRINAT